MTQLAHNWMGHTEAREIAIKHGAVIEGTYWVRPPGRQTKERYSAHWFDKDGLEIGYWHYNFCAPITVFPARRIWHQDFYDQLEKEILT